MGMLADTRVNKTIYEQNRLTTVIVNTVGSCYDPGTRAVNEATTEVNVSKLQKKT